MVTSKTVTVGKGMYLCSSTKRVVNHESANQKLRFDIFGAAELSELTENDFFHKFTFFVPFSAEIMMGR